jgi:hypothetical protein
MNKTLDQHKAVITELVNRAGFSVVSVEHEDEEPCNDPSVSFVVTVKGTDKPEDRKRLSYILRDYGFRIQFTCPG